MRYSDALPARPATSNVFRRCSAEYTVLTPGSKSRVVASSFLKHGFHAGTASVERGRIVAVQVDHLRARLTAPDNLEGVFFKPRADRIGNGYCRFTYEAQFGPDS